MAFKVLLTRGAQRDLAAIHDWITTYDSPGRAAHVLGRLEDVASKLAQSPERGSVPEELRFLGIADFRQVYFKPYRIIYRVMGKEVHVYLIVDGRRDLQSLLARRLLES